MKTGLSKGLVVFFSMFAPLLLHEHYTEMAGNPAWPKDRPSKYLCLHAAILMHCIFHSKRQGK